MQQSHSDDADSEATQLPGLASRLRTSSAKPTGRRSRSARQKAKSDASDTVPARRVQRAGHTISNSTSTKDKEDNNTDNSGVSSTRTPVHTATSHSLRSLASRLTGGLMWPWSHHAHTSSLPRRTSGRRSDYSSSPSSRGRTSRFLHTLWNWEVTIFWPRLRMIFLLVCFALGAVVLIALTYIAATDSEENSMGVLDMLAHRSLWGRRLTAAAKKKPCACARQRFRMAASLSYDKPSAALMMALLSRPGDLAGVHVRQGASIAKALREMEQSCGMVVREIKGRVRSLDALYVQLVQPFRERARGEEWVNNRNASPTTDRNRCVVWLVPVESVTSVAGGLKEVLDSNSVRGRMIVPRGGRGLFVLIANVPRSGLKDLMPHRVVHMMRSID